MKNLDWDVKVDEFESPTPLGRRKFTNIIATLDPKAERRLVLAAHYDSKLMEPVNGKYFKGATDSAVPCAMMLEIAHTLHEKLKSRELVSVVFPSFGNDMRIRLLLYSDLVVYVQALETRKTIQGHLF